LTPSDRGGLVQGGVKAQNGTQSFVHTYQVLTPGGTWQAIGKKNTNKLALTYTPGAGCAQGIYKFRVRSALPTDHSQRSD
jgi:hypothetical protein